ncbi:MAG: hypothetical protein NZ602_10620 [Thermoguttaceae bacterium]|nr:hypothetical protein [Thermoguttaceae bacterium]MDW8038956.1 hypothetical protein [Thermoguttaceae bacterium]
MYCLKNYPLGNYGQENTSAGIWYRCPNPECREELPVAYVQATGVRTSVLSAVGFRGHGKSVYFSSLLYLLWSGELARVWPGASACGLSDESLRVVNQNVVELTRGQLPPATPSVFPKPAALKIQGTPWGDRIFLLYDTSGEAFMDSRRLVKYARFVGSASTMMFLQDVSAAENPALQMHELLNTYILGMGALTGISDFTKRQQLLIVYTKGDELLPLLEEYPDIVEYLRSEEEISPEGIDGYLRKLRGISKRLKDFTEEKLDAAQFVNLAKNSFASVKFCIVSSLGCSPEGDRLLVKPIPHRVLDPLVWVLAYSDPLRSGNSWWKRLKRWIKKCFGT